MLKKIVVAFVLLFALATNLTAQDLVGVASFQTVDPETAVMSGFFVDAPAGVVSIHCSDGTGNHVNCNAIVFEDGEFLAFVDSENTLNELVAEVTITCPLTGNALADGIVVILNDNSDDEEIPVEDFEEAFDTLEDAVGSIPPNDVTVLEERPTTNPQIIALGYTTTIRCMTDCGTIWTVFYNPTTEKYAGAHVSSDQDD